MRFSEHDFIAYHAQACMECYLVQRGVRPVAYITGLSRAEIRELVKCQNKDHPSTFIKLGYLRAQQKHTRTYLIYDTRFKDRAEKLAQLWNTYPLDHRQIGLLLGYDPEVVEYFCKNI